MFLMTNSFYLRCQQSGPSLGPPCSPRGWERGLRGRGRGRGWQPPVCVRLSTGCRGQWRWIIRGHFSFSLIRFKCPNPLSRKNPEDLTWRWRECSQPRCPRSLTSRRGCQGTPARSQCPRAWCRRWAAWFCPLGLELICISSSSNLLSRVPGLRLS